MTEPSDWDKAYRGKQEQEPMRLDTRIDDILDTVVTIVVGVCICGVALVAFLGR